jgi:hypothetical protein
VDYRFFENLNSDEARTYLERFLSVASDRLAQEAVQRLQAEGVEAVPSLFEDAAARVTVVQRPAPEDLEPWIIEAMEQHHGGFPDFAGDSDRLQVLVAAYVLGQAQTFDALSWDVGREDRAEAGQPVITGFRTGADLPVLEVAENLLVRRSGNVADSARTAVETWRRVV